MTTIFDRETLLDALTELADTLANEGASVTIRVVGGAAIAIGHSERAATADMLLAMKLNASRGSRDRPDITNLLVACNVESTREAEEIFARYYPGEEMKERGRAQLTALFHEGG